MAGERGGINLIFRIRTNVVSILASFPVGRPPASNGVLSITCLVGF